MPKLDLNVEHHPAVLEQFEKRTSDAQLRVADKFTAFACSMNFVYLHVVLFALWMLVFEKSPWPTLTLIVSLEAIFLSTFVMIGQNRQAAFQQAKADRDYGDVNELLVENTNLTRGGVVAFDEVTNRAADDARNHGRRVRSRGRTDCPFWRSEQPRTITISPDKDAQTGV